LGGEKARKIIGVQGKINSLRTEKARSITKKKSLHGVQMLVLGFGSRLFASRPDGRKFPPGGKRFITGGTVVGKNKRILTPYGRGVLLVKWLGKRGGVGDTPARTS